MEQKLKLIIDEINYLEILVDIASESKENRLIILNQLRTEMEMGYMPDMDWLKNKIQEKGYNTDNWFKDIDSTPENIELEENEKINEMDWQVGSMPYFNRLEIKNHEKEKEYLLAINLSKFSPQVIFSSRMLEVIKKDKFFEKLNDEVDEIIHLGNKNPLN